MARTREFDEDEALDAAMKVFWDAGYDGASMDMLTSALGIGKPSLYAAFGNKRQLYTRAVERYVATVGGRLHEALEREDFHDAIRAFWDIYAKGENGCFLVQSGLACSTPDVTEETATRRKATEALLAKRITRAKKDGQLADDTKVADLARYVASVAYGLSVQSRNGASVLERSRVADFALRALSQK